MPETLDIEEIAYGVPKRSKTFLLRASMARGLR
jgi:hypothetical protein